MNSLVFRIVTTFRSPHSVLLGLSGGVCYLYLFTMTIYLGFSGVIIVVATTRQNSTCDMLTSAKLSVGYLVVGITRELNKEPSLY